MPRTLRVHLYDTRTQGVIGEQGYITAMLRRFVAAIAQHRGIVALTDSQVLDELCFKVFKFLQNLALQAKAVSALGNRKETNFGDVVHALSLSDPGLFAVVIARTEKSAHLRLCPPIDCTLKSLQAYTAIRLGKSHVLTKLHQEEYQRQVEAEAAGIDTSGIPTFLTIPRTVTIGSSFLQGCLERTCSQIIKEGKFPSIPPIADYTELSTNPDVLCPMKPRSVTTYAESIQLFTSRKQVANCNLPAAKAQQKGKGGPLSLIGERLDKLALIERPVRFSQEQQTLLTYLGETSHTLLMDTDPDLFPYPGLPLAMPSHFEPWMPLLTPSLDVMITSPLNELEKLRTLRPDQGSSLHPSPNEPPEVEVAATDAWASKVALQLETCNIEFDFPPMKRQRLETPASQVVLQAEEEEEEEFGLSATEAEENQELEAQISGSSPPPIDEGEDDDVFEGIQAGGSNEEEPSSQPLEDSNDQFF